MNLKPLVNNFELYAAFQLYIKNRIEHLHRELETASDLKDVYRFQGQIASLKRLLSLREEINRNG